MKKIRLNIIIVICTIFSLVVFRNSILGVTETSSNNTNTDIFHSALSGVIAGGLVTLFLLIIFNSKHKVVRKATYAKEYIVNGSVKLKNKEDICVSADTTSLYDPQNKNTSNNT